MIEIVTRVSSKPGWNRSERIVAFQVPGEAQKWINLYSKDWNEAEQKASDEAFIKHNVWLNPVWGLTVIDDEYIDTVKNIIVEKHVTAESLR